jgi:hypothetical protein
VEIALPFDLLDRLDAARTDRDSVHHDLCQLCDPHAPAACTCGIPALLADLAAALGLDEEWPLSLRPIPARTP